MIKNDDSSIINKLETSLTDDARVIIYDCHMFIVQTTGANPIKQFYSRNLRIFVISRMIVPGKPFQLRLMFAGKVRA
jgi:hypothetical protein